MSGAGVISIRLPSSLIEALEANALRAGMDIHGAARQLIEGIRELTDAEIAALPDPPKELDNPRLSLYVGWAHVETLRAVSDRAQLSVSDVVRRLVYRQVADEPIWLRESRGLPARAVLSSGEKLDYELFAWAGVVLVVVVVGGVVFWLWSRSRQRKSDSKPPTPTPSSEPRPEVSTQ